MALSKPIHKLVSPLLYQSGLYQRLWRARSRKQPFAFAVIYHRVVPDDASRDDAFDIEKGVSASQFERQMRFLRRHFTPEKSSRIQSGLGREIRFTVTLDDGYEDNYRVAAPILKRLGIPATFYVVSDFVGTDRLFWWEQIADMMRRSTRSELDLHAVTARNGTQTPVTSLVPMRTRAERGQAYERLCASIRNGPHAEIPAHLERAARYFGVELREQGREFGLMNWEQVRDLVSQGFEIGGHTATHCNVVGADEALLQRELIASIERIETMLDAPVESFAYPYGIFEPSSETLTGLLARTNCKAAFTVEQGVVTAATPAYELPRTKMNRPYHFACAFNIQDTLNRSLISN